MLRLKCVHCNRSLGDWSSDRAEYRCAGCHKICSNRGGILDFLGSDYEDQTRHASYGQLSSFARLQTSDEQLNSFGLRMGLLRSFLPVEPANSPKLFLDVGCGYGAMLVSASCHFDLVIGINTDLQELKTAQTMLTDLKVQNFILFRASALNLPFLPDQFHGVSCIQVLEHVSEPQTVVSQVRLVMESRGCLYLSVPNRFMFRPEPHTELRGIGYLPKKPALWYASRAGKGWEYSSVKMLNVYQVSNWLREEFGDSYKLVRSGCHQSRLGKWASALWEVPILSVAAKWFTSDIEAVAWTE
jgi:ubiquinone/menaquinone biosynthesis C-methylase UbiE